MCELATIATVVSTGMGIAKSVADQNAKVRSLESRAESVNRQLERSYVEQGYESREQAEAALDEGYVADIKRRQSVATAKVRASGLGIRGTTANELSAEEDRIGYFNTAGAEDKRRNADAGYTISTSQSYANAHDEIDSLRGQAPTMFESLLGMASGGLQGYMTGRRISHAMENPRMPTRLA